MKGKTLLLDDSAACPFCERALKASPGGEGWVYIECQKCGFRARIRYRSETVGVSETDFRQYENSGLVNPI